ncbi:MAG: ATP-binding protein [Pseudomonadota bacterium]
MVRRTLFIVCGLPGAGKTTHARTLAQTLDAVRFNPDEWMQAIGFDLWDEAARDRIETLQWQIAQTVLAAGAPCIIEWGTWGRAERDALREGARALGAAVELHYLSAPPEVLLERIRRRGAEDPAVTLEDLEGWLAVFQAPTAEEFECYDASRTISL